MIKKIIAWIIELFRPKPKNQKILEEKVEQIKENLEEIDEKELSDSDIINILDK